MSIRRDPGTGIYYIDIEIKGVPRLRRSADTTDREAAQELHDRLRSDLWREKNVGKRPEKTWDELTVAWLERCEKKGKRSISDDRDKLRWLLPHFTGKTLKEITARKLMNGTERTLIETVLEIKAKSPNGARHRSGKVSPSTINRYASLITSMLYYAAKKLGWLDATAVPALEKNKEPGEDEIGIVLTHKEAARLIAELPPHLAVMAHFSLAMGVRQKNCTHLEWRRVDLERRIAWVEARDAKGKRTIRLQLNDDAMDILRGQKGKHPRWVFPYQRLNPAGAKAGKPRPITQPAGSAWKKALERAGIDPAFRWHDMRHTWATWHVQAGTPLDVLQKLGGWSDYRMVQKYAKYMPDHLARFANNSRLPIAEGQAAPISQEAQNVVRFTSILRQSD